MAVHDEEERYRAGEVQPGENPENEGHTAEWQDRARVVLDAREAVKKNASPNQSPVPGTDPPAEDERCGKKDIIPPPY